jgi:hypothetical protein
MKVREEFEDGFEEDGEVFACTLVSSAYSSGRIRVRELG